MSEADTANTITSIEAQKNKERVNVFVNGEFSFAASLEIVYSKKLVKGMKIDIESITSIAKEDSYIKAKGYALKIIEYSSKTECEIEKKLLEKGYEEDVIARVMEFLKRYSFVDDERYVEYYIKEKAASQGSNKIKYALLAKGVPEAIIANKLSLQNPEDEGSIAYSLAEKKYKSLVRTENDTKKIYKKLGDFLIRKGYSFELTKRVVKEILNVELD